MTKAMLIQNKRETKAGKAMVEQKDGTFTELVIPGLVTAKVRPGRPMNPDSERQKRLAEMNKKRETGELKRGRPILADSERQKRLAERMAKEAAGVEIKRGRPKMTLADVLVDVNI
jgi:hypothetical protein